MDDMRPEYDLKNMQWLSTGKYAERYKQGVIVNGVKQEPALPLLAEDEDAPEVPHVRCYRCGYRLPARVTHPDGTVSQEFVKTEHGMICTACQEDVRYGYTDTIGRVEAVIKQQIRRRKIQSN